MHTHTVIVKKKIGGGKKGAQPDRPVDISRLDIRVGVVISAEKVCIIILCVHFYEGSLCVFLYTISYHQHSDPNVSSLYVEKIDVGEKGMIVYTHAYVCAYRLFSPCGEKGIILYTCTHACVCAYRLYSPCICSYCPLCFH